MDEDVRNPFVSLQERNAVDSRIAALLKDNHILNHTVRQLTKEVHLSDSIFLSVFPNFPFLCALFKRLQFSDKFVFRLFPSTNLTNLDGRCFREHCPP